MTNLLGVGLASEFVHTVVLTGAVERVAPVSAMLIANPENGKTSIAIEKTSEERVLPLTDVTGKGLKFLCQMKPDVTHFVINDMGIVMAHSAKSREYFFGMLLAMTEEGIKTMASPDGIESVKLGRKGIIACITTDQAQDNRMWWQRRGLARRMVPFHFALSEGLIIKIKDNIMRGHVAAFEDTKPSYPKLAINVHLDDKLAVKVRELSDQKAPALGQIGISLQIRYQALVKAHALFRSWKPPVKVTEEDVFFLQRIAPYVDWQMPGLFL